jgi:hypothetical protein
VIDLEDSRDPTIMWELKIPGYSTYLHPYDSEQAWVQHLIGLGYDTALTQRWWTTTAGVKVDLYTIDYTQSPISIEQTHTLTMWEQGSWTEVAENPRQFVWNNDTNTLLLPVVLTEAIKGSNCQVYYDANGQEETRDCYETVREVTNFAWLKEVNIDLEEWITQESLIDLKPLVSQFININGYEYWYDDESETSQLNPRMIRNLMMRAWFVEDEVYLFTNQSVTFSDEDKYPNSLILEDWNVFTPLDYEIKYCESIKDLEQCTRKKWVSCAIRNVCRNDEMIPLCFSSIMDSITWEDSCE